MGHLQSVPLPSINKNLQNISNLSREQIEKLWTTYNLSGGSWVLDINKMINLFNDSININTDYFFSDDEIELILSVFDTNCEGMIDAFEFFIGLALISGMDLIDKLQFVFSVYDFNSSRLLQREGLTLLIKSSTNSVLKSFSSHGHVESIKSLIVPTVSENDINSYVNYIFKSSFNNKSTKSTTNDNNNIIATIIESNSNINVENNKIIDNNNIINNSMNNQEESIGIIEFTKYCLIHPIISSWLIFLSNIPDYNLDISYEKITNDPGIVLYNRISDLNNIKITTINNSSIISNNTVDNNNNNINNNSRIINSSVNKPIKKAFLPFDSCFNIDNKVITKHDILCSREDIIIARNKLKKSLILFEETKEEVEFLALERGIDIYTAAKRAHIDYIGIAADAKMNLRLLYPDLDPNNLPNYENDEVEIELNADRNPIPNAEIELDVDGNPIPNADNVNHKAKENPFDQIKSDPLTNNIEPISNRIDPQESSSDEESEKEEIILERRPWFETTDLGITKLEDFVGVKERRGGQGKVASRVTIMKKTAESAVKEQTLLDEIKANRDAQLALNPNPFPNLKPDPPNDTLNLLWIHGYSGYIRKGLEYDCNGDPLFLSSRHVISMKNLNPKYDPFKDAKNNNWSQRCFSNHQYPITSMSLNSTRDILVTADIISNDSPSINQINNCENDQARLIFWNIHNGCYINSINLVNSNGVQYLDYGSDNKYLLMLMSDNCNTLMILDLTSFQIVHVNKLGNDVAVYDIKFTNSNSVYMVATSNGIKFFINEECSFVGSIDRFLTYNCYKGIYKAENMSNMSLSTILCKFIGMNEMISSTIDGKIILWNGRHCKQILQVHNSTITALYFQPHCNTVATIGKDGKIFLLKLMEPILETEYNEESQVISYRLLDIILVIDIMVNPTISGPGCYINSICLNNTGTKVLIGSLKGDVRELSCLAYLNGGTGNNKNIREGKSIIPELEGLTTLGIDINGGPIVESHWNNTDVEANKSNAIYLCKKQISSENNNEINKSSILGELRDKIGNLEGYFSCSMNGFIHLWINNDLNQIHQCIKSFNVGIGLKKITASYNNIAVILDDYDINNKSINKGIIHIYSIPDRIHHEFKLINKLKVTSDNVLDVKFSSNNSIMAVSCKNMKIYIYIEENNSWILRGKLALNHQYYSMDFSTDSKFIRVLDVNESLTIFDLFVKFGMIVTTKELYQSIPSWSTYSCPCDDELKGIWNGIEKCNFYNKLNIIDRTEHVFITGYENGTLSVSRLPDKTFYSSIPDNYYNNKKVFSIHCGPIASAIIISDNNYYATIVTSGVCDGTIKIWKLFYDFYYEISDVKLIKKKKEIKKIEEKNEKEEEEELDEDGNPIRKRRERVVFIDARTQAIDLNIGIYIDRSFKNDEIDGHNCSSHLFRRFYTDLKNSAVEPFISTLGLDPVLFGLPEVIIEEEEKERLFLNENGEETPSAKNNRIATEKKKKELKEIKDKEKALVKKTERNLFLAKEKLVPNDTLEMEWIHGYSSREVRGGVRYTKEGLIVYPSGCMSIIYDKNTGTQQHIRVHYDQITCLDLHIELGIAVSSHKGSGNIKVCIWIVTTTRGLGLEMNVPTGTIVSSIDCGDVNGVSAVNFSKCGKYVAFSCQNPGHNVRIYDWKSSFLLSEITGGPNKILGLVFSNYQNNNNNLRLLYGGIKHFNFITLRSDRLYNTNIGIYDNILSKRYSKKYSKKTKKINVNCVISLPMSNNNYFGNNDYVPENEFILGLADGTLAVIRQGENFVFKYIYVQKIEEDDEGEEEDDEEDDDKEDDVDDESSDEEEEIDEFDEDYGSITALCTMNINKEGSPLKYYIITAGTFGHIKVLSSSFVFLAEFNIYDKIYGEIALHPLGKMRGIRSISVNKMKGTILYGTSCGEIGEIELEDGNHILSTSSKIPLVTSHFKSELHALSVHISRQECITAGDDKTLRIWDLETNTLKRILFLPDVARAITYHKSGLDVEIIIIGYGGRIIEDIGEREEDEAAQIDQKTKLKRAVVQTYTGLLIVYKYDSVSCTMTEIGRDSTPADAITCIMPEPVSRSATSGNIFYVASLDTNLYMYLLQENFTDFDLRHVLKGHDEGIKSIDVTTDGEYIQSVSVTGKTIIWNKDFQAPISEEERYEQMPKLVWFKKQTIVGRDTIGIFPPYSLCSDITSLSVSNQKPSLCITGDKYGQLKLFTMPCPVPDYPFSQYYGHTVGGISNVMFSANDKYVITIGTNDNIMIKWKVIKSEIQADSYSEIKTTQKKDGVVKKEVGKKSAEDNKKDDKDEKEIIALAGVNRKKEVVKETIDIAVPDFESSFTMFKVNLLDNKYRKGNNAKTFSLTESIATNPSISVLDKGEIKLHYESSVGIYTNDPPFTNLLQNNKIKEDLLKPQVKAKSPHDNFIALKKSLMLLKPYNFPFSNYFSNGEILTPISNELIRLDIHRMNNIIWERKSIENIHKKEIGIISSICVSSCKKYVIIGTNRKEMRNTDFHPSQMYQSTVEASIITEDVTEVLPSITKGNNEISNVFDDIHDSQIDDNKEVKQEEVIIGSLSLYDAFDGSIMLNLSDNIEGGIYSIAISSDSRIIACIAQDFQHTLYLYSTHGYPLNWINNAELIYKTPVSIFNTFLLTFLTPKERIDNKVKASHKNNLFPMTLEGAIILDATPLPEEESIAPISIQDGYDEDGNLIVEEVKEVEYDEGGNVIIKQKLADELDENGNVISKTTTSIRSRPNSTPSGSRPDTAIKDDKDRSKETESSINPPVITDSNLPTTDIVPVITSSRITANGFALSTKPTMGIVQLNTDLQTLNGEEDEINNKMDSDYIFVTGGEGVFKFWRIIGNNLVFTVGITEELEKQKKKELKPSVQGVVNKNTDIKRKEKSLVKKEVISTTIVSLYIPQYSAVGDSNGQLWLWDGCKRNSKHIGEHLGEITSSVSSKKGFISASPVSIKIWSCNLNMHEIDMSLSRPVKQGIELNSNNSDNNIDNIDNDSISNNSLGSLSKVPEIIDNNINPITVVSKATRSSLGISFGKNKSSIGAKKNKVIFPSIGQQDILNIGFDNKKIKKSQVDVNILQEILITDIISSLNRSEYLLWTGSDYFNRIRNIVNRMDVDSYNQRLLLNFTSSLSIEYAIDSGKSLLLSEGISSPITNMLAHPTEPNTVITSHQDFTVRVWDLSQPGHGLQGILRLHRIPTAMLFRDDTTLVIAIGDKHYEENHELELAKHRDSEIEKKRILLKKDFDEDLNEDISIYMQEEERDASIKAKKEYLLFIAMNEEDQKAELERRVSVKQDEEYEKVNRRTAFKNKLKKSYEKKLEDIIEEFIISLGNKKVDRNATYLNGTGDMQRLHTNDETSSLLFFNLTSSSEPMVVANPIRRASQQSHTSQVSDKNRRNSQLSQFSERSNSNKIKENDNNDLFNNDLALKYDDKGNLIVENSEDDVNDNNDINNITKSFDFIPIDKRYLTRQLLLLGEIGNVGTGKLYQIKISPNKNRLVTCSHDGNLYIYNNNNNDNVLDVSLAEFSSKNRHASENLSRHMTSDGKPTSSDDNRPKTSENKVSRPSSGNIGENVKLASKKVRPNSGLKSRPLSDMSDESEIISINNDILELNNNNNVDMLIINEVDDENGIINDDDVSDEEKEEDIKFIPFLKLEGILAPPMIVTRDNAEYQGHNPVAAMDWSCNNRFIRTFGPCNGGIKHAISSAYFDFEPLANKLSVNVAPPKEHVDRAVIDSNETVKSVKLKKTPKEFDADGNLLPRFYEDGTPVLEKKPKEYDEEGNLIPQLDYFEDSDDEEKIPVKIIAKYIDTKKELDIFLNSKIDWCSISSPGAPEAHGIMRTDCLIESISSIDGNNGSLICVSYNNATVKLFRIPVYTAVDTPPIAEISNFFTSTPYAMIMPISLDRSIRIVAASKTNGIIAIFKVEEN